MVYKSPIKQLYTDAWVMFYTQIPIILLNIAYCKQQQMDELLYVNGAWPRGNKHCSVLLWERADLVMSMVDFLCDEHCFYLSLHINYCISYGPPEAANTVHTNIKPVLQIATLSISCLFVAFLCTDLLQWSNALPLPQPRV